MSEREDQLRRDAQAMAEAVDRDLQGAFRPASEHAERVRDRAQELSVIADRTSRIAVTLNNSDGPRVDRGAVAELAAMTEILRSLAGELHVMTRRSIQDLDNVRTQLVQTVRSTALGNRRRYERFEIDVAAEASFSGRRESARVINLSLGGAKMDLAIDHAVGTVVALRVAGFTHELAGEVVRVSEGGTQLRFTIGDDAAEELRLFLERVGSTKPGQGD